MVRPYADSEDRRNMMGEVLYSAGYGIITGTRDEKRDKFVKRLQYIQRGIGKPLTIVDIRTWGSGSRNGPLFAQPKGDSISGMRRLAGLCNYDEYSVDYVAESDLCNRYGGALWQLRAYRGNISTRLCFPGSPDLVREAFERVSAAALKGERAVILLCGCKNAFKPNGTTWNCHRVPLAELLVEILGDGWTTVHL